MDSFRFVLVIDRIYLKKMQVLIGEREEEEERKATGSPCAHMER